jgi:acyl-CoA thioester hydrolase
MSERAPQPTRIDYRHFVEIQTRWEDNDLYGHVNNVVYYSYFDTVVNRFLIEQGGLQIHSDPVIGVVVESQCSYFSAIAYPDLIEVGLGVSKLGSSSVVYELGVFRKDESSAVAAGRFVHVFVQRGDMRPVPMPESIRIALGTLSA